MHDDPTPNLPVRLDPVCDRFEAAWLSGGRPLLEEYLPLVAEADRRALLRELLALELEYRTRSGETPAADEYRRRLPEHTALIEEVFTAASTTHPGKPAPPTVPGYEILEEVGRGGMGVVYKARHVGLNRIVALKMILAGGHASEIERARFKAEAEAVARLCHPNIVQIYEIGESGGCPFFSLEFVADGSLAAKLDGTPWQPQAAAELVESLARAVHAAHEQQIVHRDLKPANVLLAADGTPKVTDFGLAKRMDEQGRTTTGAVLGTPSYMAPEQAGGKGKEVGPAADGYALGAMLYECLTGRPPFRAATAMDTMLQVISDDPVPPRQLQSKTPRDLETICLKCLSKEPARRYASAEGLADDLHRFLVGEPIRARPVGAVERAVKWVRRHAAISTLTAAMLVVAVLGVAGVLWKYLDAEQQKGIAEARRKDAEQQKGVALGKEKEAKDEAAKAERASDYLVSIFELADANGPRGTMTPRQILDDAEKSIPQQFADQPELRDKLLQKIGTVEDKLTAAAPLAMILEASGTVQLQSTRDPNRRPIPQTLLYTGDRLTLAADAQVQLVVLSDWHKERLRPGTEATIRRKGCEPADAVAERNPDIMMTFVHLPKGTFYMGWGRDAGDGKGGFISKGVKTEIQENFEIAVHDVTQGQWQAVMGENPSYFSRFGGGRLQVKDISDEELKLFPVESVSWDDAQAFIQKLNEQERDRGYLYRLPTEAEGEYACRGGATSEEECSHHFYFDKPTDDLSSDQANFDGEIPFGNAPKGKNLVRTTRVGAYPPNKLGLCDMHGNVYQWCADLYDPKDSGPARVFRGGNWISIGSLCRAAYRNGVAPTYRNYDMGFRLARVPSGTK